MITALRLGLIAAGLTAIGLIGAITLEIAGLAADDRSADAMPRLQPPALAPVRAARASDDGAESAARVLARPLFSANRQPPASVAGSVASLPKAMPRLTGVVVSPVGRFALFANAEGGRPLVMREGDHVGAVVIEAIVAGEVTVRGPDGALVLRSTFDETAAQASLPVQAALEKTGFQRLPMPFRSVRRVARAN